MNAVNAVDAVTEQFEALERAFEGAAEATEQLLGEYALFVLEHEEVTAFLQDYLGRLRYDFELALRNLDGPTAAKLLGDVQLLFGEAQLKVNRGVIPPSEQVSSAALSKTNF